MVQFSKRKVKFEVLTVQDDNGRPLCVGCAFYMNIKGPVCTIKGTPLECYENSSIPKPNIGCPIWKGLL